MTQKNFLKKNNSEAFLNPPLLNNSFINDNKQSRKFIARKNLT